MSHHSKDTPFGAFTEKAESEEERRRLTELLKESVGPTGLFPDGKLTPEDEGGLAFAIGAKDGKVVLEFGGPVHWIGFTPEQAVDLAEHLMQKAAKMGFARPVRIKP